MHASATSRSRRLENENPNLEGGNSAAGAAMFLQALGVAGRIVSRRMCSRLPALALWQGRVGGRLEQGSYILHGTNLGGAAAATDIRSFGSFLREHKPHAMAIAGWSTAGVGLWYMKKNARPSKIDWVEAGVVSPVIRKQNGCGCCWAMAAVASVEALHYLNTKQSITLSVQELIDCDTENDGCKRGRSKVALAYILKNGLSSESSYPYMAQDNISGCKKDKTVAAKISGYKFVKATEDALEEAVGKQPVIVRLQWPADMRSYKGGIIEREALPSILPDGSTMTAHAVLIVGYGTDNGVKFWRFKNSWGNTWGEGGFGRIRRHVTDKRGVLGIFMDRGVYPVIET